MAHTPQIGVEWLTPTRLKVTVTHDGDVTEQVVDTAPYVTAGNHQYPLADVARWLDTLQERGHTRQEAMTALFADGDPAENYQSTI